LKFTLAEKNQKIVNEMEKSKTRKSSPQTQKDKKKTKKEKPSRSAEHIQPGMNELVERTPPHEIWVSQCQTHIS